jgi:hypothetical protein
MIKTILIFGINILYAWLIPSLLESVFKSWPNEQWKWQPATPSVLTSAHCVYLFMGRAITEAVSRWLPTAAARVQSRVWSSGICGGPSGVGAGFLRVLRFPLSFIPPNSPSSQSPGAGTMGQWVADVPSGPSLDSTPHYAN